MSTVLRIVALALASLSLTAHAQVFKCAQPGGAVVYQSKPCPVAGPPAAHPTVAQLNAAQQAADAKAKADDPYASSVKSRPGFPGPLAPSVAEPPHRNVTQADASEEERRRACTIALSNQMVLAHGRTVFTYDQFGNKQYIQDSDRAGAQARARQSETRNCQ